MEHASTILIVDDELGGRKTLEALLKSEGFNLASASSGAEALDKAAKLMPDLVLLDVMMPGMDGFEVCRRLRADPLLAEVPVIMVTALDDRDSRLRGIEVGADDFVSKPIDRAELRARVRTTTRLNRYRRLLSERTKFEWVVEQAGEGYMILDESGNIRYANPQAQLYLGLPHDDTGPILETFLELAARLYRCEPQAAWATWKLRPSATDSPLYLVRPDSPMANALWLHVEVLDLPSGREGGWLLRLRDVSTEMTLQRDTWSFQVMVGHKLRTPLTNMIGSLELITRHAEQMSADEIAEFSEITLRNAKRLHSHVEDILQYVNVSGLARSGGECSLTQVQSLVAHVGAELGLEKLSVSTEEGLGEGWVLLPSQAFELILWEILENAIKFHPQQSPQIDIQLSRKDDAPDHASSTISIQMRDDGVALTPEMLAHAWAPYYQAEKRFTGEITGMGLGLPMVATLVWGAGGTCYIQNRKDGPGVVVELDLPYAPDEHTA